MITIEEACSIHELSIKFFGGSYGIRDQNMLISAINRPYTTFENVALYPSPVDKAAAIAESIIKNHPFIDGNKRTGYILMRMILLTSGLDIEASEDEKYLFIIRIAENRFDFDRIKNWIASHLISAK